MGHQLTRKQAADMIGVPSNWLARGAMGLNASKDLTFTKYGKRVVRYDSDDVEEFKQRHKTGQETE